MNALLVIIGLSTIFLSARYCSKIKAKTGSYVADNKRQIWLYLSKSDKGYKFRSPENKIEVLTDLSIFKDYKF